MANLDINESCTLALPLLLLDTFFRHTEASAGCNFAFEFASRIHRFWCKVTKCPNWTSLRPLGFITKGRKRNEVYLMWERVLTNPTNWLAPKRAASQRTVALHRHRRVYGFESRWSHLNFLSIKDNFLNPGKWMGGCLPDEWVNRGTRTLDGYMYMSGGKKDQSSVVTRTLAKT